MPQMSPMLWTILFIYFIFLFLIFNILNYFFFIPQNVLSQDSTKSYSNNQNFLTWKW